MAVIDEGRKHGRGINWLPLTMPYVGVVVLLIFSLVNDPISLASIISGLVAGLIWAPLVFAYWLSGTASLRKWTWIVGIPLVVISPIGVEAVNETGLQYLVFAFAPFQVRLFLHRHQLRENIQANRKLKLPVQGHDPLQFFVSELPVILTVFLLSIGIISPTFDRIMNPEPQGFVEVDRVQLTTDRLRIEVMPRSPDWTLNPGRLFILYFLDVNADPQAADRQAYTVKISADRKRFALVREPETHGGLFSIVIYQGEIELDDQLVKFIIPVDQIEGDAFRVWGSPMDHKVLVAGKKLPFNKKKKTSRTKSKLYYPYLLVQKSTANEMSESDSK